MEVRRGAGLGAYQGEPHQENIQQPTFLLVVKRALFCTTSYEFVCLWQVS
jgi:hypothetical protein